MHSRLNVPCEVKSRHVVPHFNASTFQASTDSPGPAFLFGLVPDETKRIEGQLCPISIHLFRMFRLLCQVKAFTECTDLHSQQTVKSHAKVHLKVRLVQFQLAQLVLSVTQLCATQ